MPSPVYLVCRRDDKKSIRYQWDTVSTPSGQIDIGPLFTVWVAQYRSFCTLSVFFGTAVRDLHDKISLEKTLPVPVLTPEIFNALRSIQRLKRLQQPFTMTLTRAQLTELDALLAEMSISEQSEILDTMADLLKDGVHSHSHAHAVGIDFSEVFWVQAGQSAPAHYRPDVDRVVTTLAAYQQQTAAFSYQLARVFFARMEWRYSGPASPSSLSNYFYSGWQSGPLQNNEFAHNDLTHILEVKRYLKHRKFNEQIILRLGPQINLDDLRYCYTDFMHCIHLREVVLLLSGAHYTQAENRALVIQIIVGLANEFQWRFFPQVFLLTRPVAVGWVHELYPDSVEQSGFRALTEESGYYLSDPQVFATIIRNLQTSAELVTMPVTDMFDVTQQVGTQQQSTYIINSGEPTDKYRKSKHFDAQQLKAQLSFTVTQQYTQTRELTQNQTLQQEQQLNQQQELSQTQARQQQRKEQMVFNPFRSTVSFNEFYSQLYDRAVQRQTRPDSQTQLLSSNGYYTEYHAKTNLLSRLIRDQDFRLKVTATIFGRFSYNPDVTGLSKHSFVQMDWYVADYLLGRMTQIVDGLDPESLRLEEGLYSIMMSPLYGFPTLIEYHGEFYDKPSTDVSHLGVLSMVGYESGKPNLYQSVIQASALWREEDFALTKISETGRAALRETIHALLTLFRPNHPQKLEDAALFRGHITVLYKVHCPTMDLSPFKRFLDSFPELNRDYCKIMLYPILKGYRARAEKFVFLIQELEKRALLKNFRRIFFDYAPIISSVSDLLQTEQFSFTVAETTIRDNYFSPSHYNQFRTEKTPLFLQIAQTTPLGQDPTAWPPFETFVHHFLLFTSKQNMDIHHIEFKTLQKFWQRIDAKMYQYYQGDLEATEHSMHLLVKKIICPKQGLVIAPVCLAMTILNGIEQRIENGMRHDFLEETLVEWDGVSLLRTDSLHAGLHDGFGVVTKEMAVEITQLRLLSERGDTFHLADCYKTSYRFSAQELKTLLDEQCIVQTGVYDTFLIKIFRYLGCQSLREPIHFYRQLHQFDPQQIDPVYVYFRHMLFGYFVLTKTGAHYTRPSDFKTLYQEFVDYLLRKKYSPANNAYLPEEFQARAKEDPTKVMRDKITGEYKAIIATCVRDFYANLQAIKIETNSDYKYSLWVFYAKYRSKASEIEKGLAYIGMNLAPTFETIPLVFKKKFAVQHVAKFFLVHQEELKKSSHIFNSYPNILIGLMVAKIRETFAATVANKSEAAGCGKQILNAKKMILYNWLESNFPHRSIEQFTHNVVDLETLVTEFSEWALADDYELLAEPVNILLSQHSQIKTVLQILQLIAQQRNLDQYQAEWMHAFLGRLTQVPDLVASQAYFQELLPPLNTACMTYAKPEWLMPLLDVTRKLVDLDATAAGKTLKTLLLHCPWQQTEPPFFLQYHLSAEQLQGLAAVLADTPVDLSLLACIFRENPQTDFSEVYAVFHACDAEQSAALAQLALYIHQPNSDPTLAQIIAQCSTHPKAALLLLARLTSLYHIDATRIRTILTSPDIKQAIKHLEQALYAENLERFDYDRQEIAQYMAKIRKKSLVDGKEDEPLAQDEQDKLLADYETMMFYMLHNPVLITQDEHGLEQALTIHQLDEDQCKTLYQLFSAKLQDETVSAQKKHAYRLTLLALSCEAHYRTTKKFPLGPQILCELHDLDDPASTIQEVKTGGGKSIISELRAVLLCAEGWTVDIATENIELAETALRKFKLFYDYLGVPAAKEVIRPDSHRSAYIEGGIHHGTPANFSFFRANMALKKKTLPKHVALLCDEIDAELTTTLQKRLAGVLDPIYADTKSWSVVQAALLAFVRDKEIFLNNNCDEQDDVHNFRTYFCRQQTDKALTQFVEKIPHDMLNMLLNSARMPEVLQDGVDYLSILRPDQKKVEQYAAPILNIGTKRPEPAVSCAEGVQQFIHEDNNARRPKGAPAYSADAMSETIMTISAKNFFDYYALVIGWTGSPGSKNELREFFQENGLQAYYYPVFHPDLGENLGTFIVETRVAQYEAVLEKIRAERAQKPGQPLVLVADSPMAVAALQQYIQTHAPDLLLQTYTGYEDSGISEQEIIARAGQDNMLTITTLSLTRGTDFESLYGEGICLLNTAADITECERIQVDGRVARNGKKGQFCHIICAEDLDPVTATISDPAERFKAHQYVISLKRQQERLKPRFLELMRYHIVMQYFVAVRAAADRILADQQGIYATSIAEKDFLQELCAFNKQSEKTYNQMIGEQAALTAEQKEAFMRQMVDLYQTALNKLISDQDLQNFQAIEPLIAVAQLQAAPLPEQVTIQDLQAASDILSSGWRVAGNQAMVEVWAMTNVVVAEFQPYFDGECSLKVATAQTLERRAILKIPKVVAEIDHIKEMIEDFAWGDAVSGVQHSVVDSTDSRVVQAFGSLIGQIFSSDIIQQCKDFVLNYLEETKQQIARKRWDELKLPDFKLPWIQTWMSRIGRLFGTFRLITCGAAFVAGPVPFIIHRFVLPTVLSWLKTMVKRWFADSESTMVQVLLGLDNAFADLSKLVDVLTNKDLKTMTIDELLKDIAPVFKNKAIQLIINKMFESPENGEMVFKLLPDLMQVLEQYKHLPCVELKRPEIMMKMVIKILQSDVVKQMMDSEKYATMLQRIQALPPEFSEVFQDCNLPQFLGVIKALAHPKFNEFINQLPPGSDFGELGQWLGMEIDALPAALQAPMRELREYQDNHERLAQDTQLAYRNIKHQYTLREEDLQAHALNSQRKLPVETPKPEPEALWMTILNLQLTQLILSYAALLLANYLLFHFSLLWVSGAFLVLFVIPVLQQMYAAMLQPNNGEDEFPKGVIPPFALPKSLSAAATEGIAPALVAIEPEPMQPLMSSPLSSAYQMLSFFGGSAMPLKLPTLSNVLPSFFR